MRLRQAIVGMPTARNQNIENNPMQGKNGPGRQHACGVA
jgi:hypothetical protein